MKAHIKGYKELDNKKVKINLERIKSRGAISTRFSEFLKENQDKIFTAKLDVENGYTKMYILKEDESPIKWLFHVDDLILIEGVKG